ncbi:hypothetical protein [Streptomyces spinoverrucosus]|uniref:hypothetical protein n=1 Tax=Streptomyces spinoverrucosus TaxID=284043 RepID=UPI001144CD98|nr:hypothetical protein [Streptomyces spinoverrucosus]
MRWRNTLAVLGLLPLNALAVGYGWLAAGMTGWAASFGPEPYRPPMTELGVACGGVALIGVALWLAGLRRAAAFQLVPLLALAVLMTG